MSSKDFVQSPAEGRNKAHIFTDSELCSVIEILKIQRNNKSLDELKLLKTQFVERFSILKSIEGKINEDTFLKLFDQLKYEFFTANQTVFEQGDIGRKMYLVLRGEVGVIIQRQQLPNLKHTQSSSSSPHSPNPKPRSTSPQKARSKKHAQPTKPVDGDDRGDLNQATADDLEKPEQVYTAFY